MQIITLQIIVTFQVLIWFDWVKPHHLIFYLLGYTKWVEKRSLPFYLQWLACYFCTSFWIGVANAVVFFCNGYDGYLCLLLFASNLIVSRLLDYLLGYQSFKP